MKAFAERLRALVRNAKGIQPLLCDGNPLTCTVALVGANLDTTIPFWKFWSDERGMDRVGWIAAHRVQHDGKFSRSRAAIERFVPQVEAPVIELNAYSAQSKRVANLELRLRTTDVLAFVLDAVRPKVIVCAGTEAMRAVDVVSLSWRPLVFTTKHYIHWGKETERLLARDLNQML